ncbi:phospholipase D family protein [Ramlibacter sp. PS4R-6]|uniref:phospholipase D family protein n=1 Tax=Ramlibacter sp. PS4R-6 TaxID=3133438 RepID=UPI0030B66C6B
MTLGHLVRRFLFAVVLAAWAVGCASLPANVDRKPSQALGTPEQTALGQFVAQRRAQDRGRSDSGFVLLDTIELAYESRLALIRNAQRTLDLQYYAIHADGSTETLLEALRAAAQRGVRVRVLLDDFNTVGKDAQVLNLAFVPNVEMRLFNPLPGSRESLVTRLVGSLHDSARIAKRMHNKMFIADNAIGITGGRNLGDAYFGVDGKSNFVDLDVLAAGRVVRDMSASFDHFWNDDLAYPMQTLVSPADLERLRKGPDGKDAPDGPLKAAAAAEPPKQKGSVMPDVAPATPARADPQSFDLRNLRFTWAPSALLMDKPGKIDRDDDEVNAGDTVVDGLLALMDGAKQDILIVSPYFVPGKAMVERFRKMKERGVRVRVLTNSLASNDAPAAHVGYARYRKDLLAAGVELHEMRAALAGASGGTGGGSGIGSAGGGSKGNTSRASLHTKAVMIDGRLAVIGSMNLDLRSQTKNSEAGLVIRSAALAGAATQVIDAMIQRGSYRVVARADGGLLWQAPPGADYKDSFTEPEATAKQRLLAGIIAPFAPDEML